MSTLGRVRALWSGFPGAPGYTNFYFVGTHVTGQFQQADVGPATTRAFTFLGNLRDSLPADVTITMDTIVDVVDSATGVLQAQYAVPSPPAPAQGSVAGGYSAPSGLIVNWKTGKIHRGRPIRGRTFIVPLGGTSYDAQGTLAAGVQTAAQARATELAGLVEDQPELVIWSRPTSKGAADGDYGIVTAGLVPDKAVILRSRRA